MNTTHLTIAATLLVNVALGIFVYLTNTRRGPNQQFLFLSLIIAAWLFCLEKTFRAVDAMGAAFWIRQSSAVTVLLPTAFNLLRLSIADPDAPWRRIFAGSRRWLVLNVVMIGLCQSGFFLRHAVMPLPGGEAVVPRPVYGPGFSVFLVYYIIAWVTLTARFVQDTRRAHGLRRAELQFTLLGWACGAFVGVLLVLVVPMVTGNYYSAQFAPLSVLFFDASIAYGIATRRIMDVAEVLRRVTAYALLTAYLVVLYGAVWFLSHLAFLNLSPRPTFLPHLLAALAVALSMAPAHGHLQRFANRLFINVQPLDPGSAIQKANRILHSISRLDELLRRFAESIAEAVGTDRIVILLRDRTRYEQAYPASGEETRVRLDVEGPLAETLAKSREPVVAETVLRLRPAIGLGGAGRRLSDLRAAIAVGIHSKRGLEGIMLLGPRLSGRIYGAIEQDTLQILCNQLAVALENAKLYTQLQDSKIYNDILLDNLISGVIAANADGVITVFNREAQRITRLSTADVLNQPINVLPPPLARALELTFERNQGLRDQEMALHQGPGEEVPVRVGSSVFRGHEGNVLGALLVFNDVTTIRKLELQVRRTDRLASLGTLSAGMAHEIKNPLVTIKTFTQLLPDRYEDGDFRETFSSLIGQEVKRIDAIVNQLLKFSRPAKPNLEPTHLHEVLDTSLSLVAQPMRQKGITLSRSYSAHTDQLHADADQLNQAFVNFLLNAIESMDGEGHLAVSTEVVGTTPYSPNLWRQRDGDRHIRVAIRDTGEGIQTEDLPRIFDPFYTTKSLGTGLGLSVAHGIIQEHGGMIDVESEPGKGTTFFVEFPLVNGGAPA